MKPEVEALIQRATTTIKTHTLARENILDLRILSESKFMHLLRTLVDETLEKRLAQPLAEGVDASSTDSDTSDPLDWIGDGEEAEVIILDEGFGLTDLDPYGDQTEGEPHSLSGDGLSGDSPNAHADNVHAEYQVRWDSLRQQHLAALETIEDRLARLGKMVQDIQFGGLLELQVTEQVTDGSTSCSSGEGTMNRLRRKKLISRTLTSTPTIAGENRVPEGKSPEGRAPE